MEHRAEPGPTGHGHGGEGTANDALGPFVAETQLAAPVRAWLAQQTQTIAIAEEVDAGFGVADLVAGQSSSATLPVRPCFDSATATHLMTILAGRSLHTDDPTTREGLTEAQVRAWAPNGWRSLRARVLEPLLEAGIICQHHDDLGRTFHAAVEVSDPFESLVAVELKLRDWRRAIAQAGRYRLFAEASYIAIPTERVTVAVCAEAERNRVGVLAVHVNSGVEVALRATFEGPLQPHRRRWAAEQVLAAQRQPSARRAGSPIC